MRAAQIKVLAAIYSCTDCSNGVFDYATLHWAQARIADGMEALVESCDGVVTVDGDGFAQYDSRGREKVGRGFRLTKKGYEVLTAHDPKSWPATERRFA